MRRLPLNGKTRHRLPVLFQEKPCTLARLGFPAPMGDFQPANSGLQDGRFLFFDGLPKVPVTTATRFDQRLFPRRGAQSDFQDQFILPLFETEIRGAEVLKRTAALLFG